VSSCNAWPAQGLSPNYRARKGVHLHLKSEREGIILSLGADGVIIKMD
jgi:hypothetical protein